MRLFYFSFLLLFLALLLLSARRSHHHLTNNDVEHLLGASSGAAWRYLQSLEKEGAIKQVGKAGRNVYYQPAEINKAQPRFD